MNFEKITIKQIVVETDDTKTVIFEVPENLKRTFEYKPGQYLTLKDVVDGEEVRRAYSISTAPSEDTIGVTVKRLSKGKMSNHIHDKWNVGDIVEVAEPEGHFVIEADHDKKRNHYFIAAGSGITPIMSMVKTLLEDEPLSICYLLYGSRNEDSIIFKSALDQYEVKYAGQLFITHTLSKPLAEKEGGLLSVFKKPKIKWVGETGRISKEKIQKFLDENVGKNNFESHFYLCGPGDVIQAAEKELEARSIAKKNIHREYFSTNAGDKATIKATSSNIKVHLNGEVIEFASKGEKPILDELIAMKKNPPYSCTSGACSSCMAKVINGKVEMEVCYALDDADLEKGLILTCQAKAVTAELEITYVV